MLYFYDLGKLGSLQDTKAAVSCPLRRHGGSQGVLGFREEEEEEENNPVHPRGNTCQWKWDFSQ